MNNRDVELNILERIESKNNKFKLYIASDFNDRPMELPRIVSNTIANKSFNTLNEVEEIDSNYIGYKEIHTIKHYIQLTFVLDKNTDFSSVNDIRNFLNHKIGNRYYFSVNGIELIIHKVGEVKDISEHSNSTYLKRYMIELEVISKEEYIEKVEKVKKVNFKIKRG